MFLVIYFLFSVEPPQILYLLSLIEVVPYLSAILCLLLDLILPLHHFHVLFPCHHFHIILALQQRHVLLPLNHYILFPFQDSHGHLILHLHHIHLIVHYLIHTSLSVVSSMSPLTPSTSSSRVTLLRSVWVVAFVMEFSIWLTGSMAIPAFVVIICIKSIVTTRKFACVKNSFRINVKIWSIWVFLYFLFFTDKLNTYYFEILLFVFNCLWQHNSDLITQKKKTQNQTCP